MKEGSLEPEVTCAFIRESKSRPIGLASSSEVRSHLAAGADGSCLPSSLARAKEKEN